MNDHGLTVENTLSTFPAVLDEDEFLHALAVAFVEKFAALAMDIDLVRIYALIDRLPEDLLDTLAYDFKVDWWDANFGLDEKRRTLKESWAVHRRLGTKGAVTRAVSAIYPDSTLDEWFDYEGIPYHFRLAVNETENRADDAQRQRVLDRVIYYKNLRSWLDIIEYIAYHPLPPAPITLATTLMSVSEITLPILYEP